jgi:hypothetical protein
MIYSDDHTPAHVHVWYSGGWAVIEIELLAVREVIGLAMKDVRRAVRITERNQEYLMQKWKEIHE